MLYILLLQYMNFIRKNILFKIFSFFFSLHMLNISVDSPDVNPDWVSEDLSVNDMESISEIICEQILHIDNAFPEFDDHDNNDGGAPIITHLDLFFYNQPVIAIMPFTYTHSHYAKQTKDLLGQFTSQVPTPPPKGDPCQAKAFGPLPA